MKRRFKAMARVFWRILGPLRRPLVRKLGDWQARQMAAILETFVTTRLHAQGGQLAAIEHSINLARCHADAAAADTSLVLDSVVRELARLQMQVEVLQQIVEERTTEPGRLTLVEDPAAKVA